MAYIQSVLQPGETIRYATTVHWVVYWRGVVAVVVAGIIYALAPTHGALHVVALVFAILFVLLGLAALGQAAWRQWTTEYAVTNKRIVLKRGFIRRITVEINMDKVASVDVVQSIPGRLLNYGTILVQATGAAIEPLTEVGSPLEFRNHITAE